MCINSTSNFVDMSQSMKEEQDFLNDFEAASDLNCHQDIIKMEVDMMQSDNPDYETTHHENIESNKIKQRGIITFFREFIFFLFIHVDYLYSIIFSELVFSLFKF